MAPHWFGGYVSIFYPQGFFGFSYPAVSHLYPVDYCRCCNLERKLFMPATGARPKETKINLMDCICLMCSGVEISSPRFSPLCNNNGSECNNWYRGAKTPGRNRRRSVLKIDIYGKVDSKG